MESGLPFFPQAASTMAGPVDALFFFLTGASVLICLLVFVPMLYFVIKYRRRPGNEVGRRVGGTTPVEITWTLIPIGLALIPFGWGATLYLEMSRPPDNAVEVSIVAKQWMWKAEHPGGQSEINQLHVPVDQPVKLTMISQDVIHSFYVPEFRTKADVLPGRYTTTWFQATRAGQFHLFCAEYCGTDHSQMVGQIIALDPGDFASWLAGGATASPADQGSRLFQLLGCPACHESGIGPRLDGVFGSQVRLQDGTTVTADEGYIRESILDPTARIVAGYQPIMPSFAGRANDEQIIQLIAYIKSLGAQSGGQPAAPGTPSVPAPAPAPSPVPSPAPSRSPTP